MMSENLLCRIQRGAKIGFVFGLIYCCFAGIIYSLSGDNSFRKHNTTVGAVLVLYLVSATLCGVVVGALKPVSNKSWWGKYLVGIFAAIPVSFGVGILLSQGQFPWAKSLWFAVITSIFIFGIGGAKMFAREDFI